MVLVNVNGQPQQMVLDPSLFDAPATVADWQAKQNVSGVGVSLEVTIPGIYFHPPGSDNLPPPVNECDDGPPFPKTTGVLLRNSLNAILRFFDLPTVLGLSTPQSTTGIVQSFDENDGVLQLTSSMNPYMVSVNDLRYPPIGSIPNAEVC
jgi:hypothetical protein